MRIYVGNLSWGTTEAELETAFAEYGDVAEVTILTDRDTGRSRGFGFVEMTSDDEAQSAIDALNGQDLDGRTLKVNKARPRTDRRGGGGGGGRGGFNDRGRDRGY